MRWFSALSEAPALPEAIADATAQLQRSLGGEPPDLCLIFVSSDFRQGYDSLAASIKSALAPRVILGCSGGGVIGSGREVEHRPALVLTAAFLPDVTLTPFRIPDTSLPDLDASPREWHQLIRVTPAEQPHFLLLADPFSMRAENLLMGLDYAYPKAVKVGGLASGATQPGENALYFNGICYRSGAVGLALYGNIALDAVVAQGCRPIGKPFRVTHCDRNILLELDGQPPLARLRALYPALEPRDRALLQSSLFLGLVMDPMKTHFGLGDFLIRNIAGIDPKKEILAVGALLREGQVVQFHLRDAQTSMEDLRQALQAYQGRNGRDQMAGALLFSCLGRGEYLYGRPSHDTQLFEQTLGAIPIGGFFCNGEIGPVGGTTYLHGYTSCFAMFRPLYVPAPDVRFINAVPTPQSA